MMSRALLIVVLALTASASPAVAGTRFYLSAKIGSTSVDTAVEDAFRQILDGDDDSKGLGLGLRLGGHLAFELAYQDFGSVPGFVLFCDDPGAFCDQVVPVEAETTAISLAALPRLPVTQRVEVYAKVGVISWETEFSEVLPGIRRSLDELDDEDVVYGLGLRLLLPAPIDLFAEYERSADSFETVSLGATLGF